MNFEPEIADDCLLVDGTETITLHSSGVVVVADAKRGMLTLKEIEFRQLGLETSDLAWNLPVANCGGIEPRQGDAIEDSAGIHWTILSVTRSSLSGVWRAVTRRQL